MLRSLVSTASRLLNDWNRTLRPDRLTPAEGHQSADTKHSYQRLRRIVLTDEVNRTILEEFDAHRASARGREETGWLLLGLREEDQALALATLPAGAGRDAGVGHVRFHSDTQALGYRILRQVRRKLVMLGVVHTHPGSLRHPSDGDFRGDSQWVGRLRGKEGVFGIGTADVARNGIAQSSPMVAEQPREHQQMMGDLCLSWYCLAEGDERYLPLAFDLTLGPDLARALRPVWPVIEEHASALERLCLQQTNVTMEVAAADEPALAVNFGLSSPGSSLRLLLKQSGVEYYVSRDDGLFMVDPKEERIDRGVYLILAELAGGTG